MKKILALDLGTKTGVAANWEVYHGELLIPPAKTLVLATPAEVKQWGVQRLNRRCDPRVIRLYRILVSIEPPDAVAFEDVEFTTFTYQVQLWSALRAAVWLAYGMTPNAPLIDCVPVATLKKFATGDFMAKKEKMARALAREYPAVTGLDDNGVDAFWILKWAEHNLGRV